MDTFNIISGIASIIGLFVTLFVANKVIKIDENTNINNQNIKVKGNDNKVGGRDVR